jgi:hypothetical protein
VEALSLSARVRLLGLAVVLGALVGDAMGDGRFFVTDRIPAHIPYQRALMRLSNSLGGDGSMETTYNLLIGIIAGVLASVMTLAGDRKLRKRRLRKMYIRLEGEYEHLDIEGQRQADWITMMKYAGDGVLNTEAWSNQLARKWKGQIFMSEAIPSSGNGVWRHLDACECGLHQIQVDELHDQIFVYWRHTSDPKGVPGEGAVIWKRRR